MQETTEMRIGQLARRAGVTPDAGRFYERRGVLPRPRRRASGYRVYDATTLEQLRLVKSLQSLGLSLEEVVEATKLIQSGEVTCASAGSRLESVLVRLDDKISELLRTRERLADVLSACRQGSCEGVIPKSVAGLAEP